MTRWEYTYLVFDSKSPMDPLDEAGREGWEAYAVIVESDDDIPIRVETYYLRRPLPPEGETA